MQAEMRADFTVMPAANMIILLAGIAALLVITGTVIVAVVRKLGIKNFGPFKTEHENTTTLYAMNEKVKDVDDICHRQMRYITDRMKIHISNIFTEMNICVPTRVAISSAIRFPLYESISNNHFTTELMPDRLPAYRGRIIDTMKDEYVSLSTAHKGEQCGKDKLPPWEQMEQKLERCVDLWVSRIAKEVLDACEKKHAVYLSYQSEFEKSGDSFRANICRNCAEKNERYAREIKRII